MNTGTHGASAQGRPSRWLRGAAALSAAIALAALTPGLAGYAQTASDEFVTGSGNAYAQIYRVGPTAARLSLAPVIGLSLADYVNTVGRGETKAADWAGIGVAERSLPDNTPTLRVASTDEGAEEGKTMIAAGGKESGTGGGLIELFGRATDAPLGESSVRMASLSIPGLIDMSDSEAHTVVGIVKQNLRRSTSVVEIGRLDLADTVRMRGLRWIAIQETGPDDKPKISGKFTVDSVSIAGMPLPLTSEGSEFEAVLGPINSALAPTGFAITAPTIEERGGQASVTPLAFEIVNSPLGRQYLAPILEALQPAREPVADAFIDIAKQIEASNEDAPDASVAVLAADLTLGIFSGSSQLHIELGGVNAFTEGAAFDNPFAFGGFKLAPGVPPQTIFTPGSPGRPAVPGTTADKGELVASVPGPGQRTIPGGRGGLAVAVGLAGLAVAIALAVADYRRMRASRVNA